jgi:hypothetical protein
MIFLGDCGRTDADAKNCERQQKPAGRSNSMASEKSSKHHVRGLVGHFKPREIHSAVRTILSAVHSLHHDLHHRLLKPLHEGTESRRSKMG